MGKYYTEIMGSGQTNFLTMFNHKWEQELASHEMPYSNASQIREGNRLRPILLAWGYYMNTPNIKHESIVDHAICIELIHKASILLDDLIDDDDARHGLSTFHTEYSKEETVLYAIFLINRSITIMYEKDYLKNSLPVQVLLNIVNSMSKGGIKEVSSKGILTFEEVIDVINLETTVLIENSFFLGYQLSNCDNSKNSYEVCNIGHLCGYCFQALNDIEPFSAPEINKGYKGTTNTDFEKNRKNIVISCLYNMCTGKERKKLHNNPESGYVYQLINKYKIIDFILYDVKDKITIIKESASFVKENHMEYYLDFLQFLNNMFKIGFQKCRLAFENDLFYDR